MLICCEKSSHLSPNQNSHLRLHRLYNKNGLKKSLGFTVIEVLVVVLVIGILTGTAISTYSGSVQETTTKTALDKIQIFFQSCKQRAKLRNVNVKIIYNESQKKFMNPDSASSFIDVPELYPNSIPKLIEVNKTGTFIINGKEAKKLSLLQKTLNGKLATLTIEL